MKKSVIIYLMVMAVMLAIAAVSMLVMNLTMTCPAELFSHFTMQTSTTRLENFGTLSLECRIHKAYYGYNDDAPSEQYQRWLVVEVADDVTEPSIEVPQDMEDCITLNNYADTLHVKFDFGNNYETRLAVSSLHPLRLVIPRNMLTALKSATLPCRAIVLRNLDCNELKVDSKNLLLFEHSTIEELKILGSKSILALEDTQINEMVCQLNPKADDSVYSLYLDCNANSESRITACNLISERKGCEYSAHCNFRGVAPGVITSESDIQNKVRLETQGSIRIKGNKSE